MSSDSNGMSVQHFILGSFHRFLRYDRRANFKPSIYFINLIRTKAAPNSFSIKDKSMIYNIKSFTYITTYYKSICINYFRPFLKWHSSQHHRWYLSYLFQLLLIINRNIQRNGHIELRNECSNKKSQFPIFICAYFVLTC